MTKNSNRLERSFTEHRRLRSPEPSDLIRSTGSRTHVGLPESDPRPGFESGKILRGLRKGGDLLLSGPNFTQQKAIELFRAFHDLQLHADLKEVALQKLRDYSAKHADRSFTIRLYLFLAVSMEKNGRPQLSSLFCGREWTSTAIIKIVCDS